MRRTRAGVLAIIAVVGTGAGFLLDQVLTASSRPTFTPSPLLAVLLVMLAASVVAFAVPVRRGVAGTRPAVDPFRALRILVLAKASSVLGAGVAGVALGLLLFLVSRPVAPSVGSWGAVVAVLIAGVILTAAALVAEHFCIIRKDDDDQHPGDPEPGFGLSHRD